MVVIECVDEFENLPANEFIVTINKYKDIILMTMMMSSCIDIEGGILLFLIPDKLDFVIKLLRELF